MAVWYCQHVVDGKVPACWEELLAAKRFLTMYEKARGGRGDYVWSDAHVVDVCAFAEELQHTKAFTGKMKLEPVQCWWLAGIFGFRDKATGLRWVRTAAIWCPRKNGKTKISVAVVLYCAAFEGEQGPEITISAGSEEQAHIPYDEIRRTIEIDPDLKSHLRAYITNDFMEFRGSGAKINLATARAKNLDGYNPSMLLSEELHAQDQDVIGVLRTAMGSRAQGLQLSISTAGRSTNSAAYDDWKMLKSVLDGTMRADRMFGVMYAGDKAANDNPYDLKTIEKLNPMYGTALRPDAIDEEIVEAKKSPAKKAEYFRTRLNIWSRAAGNLFDIESWRKCADPKLTLDAFRGFPIYVGIDLASRNDLNAVAYMVKMGNTVYTVAKYWLPRHSDRMKSDQFAAQFLEWANDNHLTLTDMFDGTYIDQAVILNEVLATLEGHNVVSVAIDDHQGNLLGGEIEKKGYQVYFVRKNAKNLTPATDDLIARSENPELLQHDGNPVTDWCVGNVCGYYDHNSNVLPKKDKPNSKANIDGADAMILANAMRLAHEAGIMAEEEKRTKANPYLTRGLAGTKAA